MANKDKSAELRAKAEKVYQQKNVKITEAPDEVKALLEELSIHQIELEMQNEELLNAQTKLEKEKEKFQKLYDYAPVGYITINQTGNIIDLNYQAAELFGKPREVFNFNSIFPFLHKDSKTDFRLMLREAYEQRQKTSSSIAFINSKGSIVHTKVNVIPFEDTGSGEILVRLTITDIVDERMQYLRELEEKELKYAEIFNHSNDAIFLFNLDDYGRPLKFLEVNRKACDLMNSSRESLLKKNTSDINTDEEMAFITRSAKEIKRNGKGLFEMFYNHKGNDKIPLEIAYYSFDLQGEFIGMAVVSDIRKRKDSEAKIRENERKYRLLAENINETILLTDLDFNVIYVSPSIKRLTGSSQEEYYKNGFKHGLTNESVKYVENWIENFLRESAQEDFDFKNYSKVFQVDRYHKDGHIINFEVSLSFLIENGKPTGIITISRDITDRVKAERKIKETNTRLQLAMEVGNLGWWDWDYEQNILVTADNKPGLLGYNPGETNFTAQDYIDMIHPEDYDKAMNAMRKHLEGKADRYEVENRLRMKDGSYKWLYDMGRIVEYTDEGKPKRLMGVIFDISDRKNAELLIQNQNEELKQLNATKDKFFSIIAHDLKNPFNTILGFTEELIKKHDELKSDDRKQILKTLNESARQNYSLLQNLLVWSRMQSNRMPFNPEQIVLSELIYDNYMLFEGTANKKGIMLKMAENTEQSCWVNADREMINTVIRNLVSNAIKYTPEGGEIVLGCEPAENDAVKVYVKDTGIGIKKHTISKLFKIEETFSTSGTSNEQGTGLGLILVNEFLEKNNGELLIDSKEGEGSTFAFTLKSVKTERQCSMDCFGDFKLLSEKIEKLDEEVKQYFFNDILSLFKTCYKSYSSRKVNAFSDEIISFSQKYKVPELEKFGTKIAESMQQFDINQLNICFGEFEELMDHVQKKKF
ncbi:PAS domain-containing sensor histidine kinase [Salinivirga cyanobacteriivorans]